MIKTICFDVETTGLDAWYGNVITCICARDSDGDEFSVTLENCSEELLIKQFIIWIRERKDYLLITKNGKRFDIPFILARVMKLGMDYCDYKFLLDMKHTDLQLVTKKWIGLDDMAKLLGVGSKLGTGLDAIKYYNEKNWDELLYYCMQDVKITGAVYERLVELGVLK